MHKGTVRWFNNTKGFGFLLSDSGEEIFIHYSGINAEGYKKLNDGERVTFDVIDTVKGGKQAVNVTVIKE